ncbi:MAG: 2-oxoglutarate dehydrogenase E1 component [Phycisphaeraceae bacterium]|nr:2-oxoglutarate dehydrogenase E1 component [Phycisphaeraceae bacterium]
MASALRASPPAVNGWNSAYLDEQYQRFKADPASISPDMLAFFQGFDLAMASAGPAAAPSSAAPAGDLRDALRLHAGTRSIIAAYRAQGHFAATLDPFGRARPRPAALALATHGLTDADLSRPVDPADVEIARPCSLGQLIEHLERAYCGSIGVEFSHIADESQRRWVAQRIEKLAGRPALSGAQRVEILRDLIRSEHFERFLHKRYFGAKRFSLEGGESLMPLLQRVLLTGSELGVEEFVIGMAHRGRLDVLNQVLGKTFEQVFTEFEDSWEEDFNDGGGDVKYHQGYSGQRTLANGKPIHLALATNPSHLEAVDPIVLGRVRAKQRLRNDRERTRVVPLIIHGDAAIAGQGVVAEIVNFGKVDGYTVGGCIHIVVNNMLGFTTMPEEGRSSPYCTDIGKMVDAPAIHVNGENPEAVVAAAQLAIEYRQQFKSDVFVDMWCFRRYGHNETDEPSFTQPTLAALIAKAPGVVANYGARLVEQGVTDQGAIDAFKADLESRLDAAQKQAQQSPHAPTIDPAGKRWKGMGSAFSFEPVDTTIGRPVLDEVCAALGRVPDGFEVNPKLKKMLADRAAIPTAGQITHADGEILAIGSLLLEGTAVRISGQDCCRGTFSHRHALLRDFKTGQPYTPLNAMRTVAESPDDAGKPGPDGRPTQARLCVHNSPLSEYAVMGFDYGYSLADPNMLVMWEAQFGDFANGAQIIIDQFICSAEYKWRRWSGLVLLLPHGAEGMGPEHTSARLERFLQLCGNDCMQVAFPSTGAQIFHLLRRQVSRKRPFRKPLIVMTPKSLIRVPTSRVDELLTGRFHEFLDDPLFERGEGADGARPERRQVGRIILCSGKMYPELAARRAARKRYDTALIRLEQLYPFHEAMFKEILARYPAKAEVFHCQEEPRNQGSFLFVDDTVRNRLGMKPLKFIGRETSASPASGSKSQHEREQEAILTQAIGPAPAKTTPATRSAHDAGANGSAPAPVAARKS